MQADKIPDEIMREAEAFAARFLTRGTELWRFLAHEHARALLARDATARKECAEIARDKANRRLKAATQSIDPNTQQAQAQFGHQIATAILTYGGRDEQR